MDLTRLFTCIGILGSLAVSAGAFEPDKEVLVSLKKGAVLITVPKGVHLNKSCTKVTLNSKAGQVQMGPLPSASGKDELGEEIYQGTVSIPIIGASPTGEIELEVRYQACTEGAGGTCFPPTTRVLKVNASDPSMATEVRHSQASSSAKSTLKIGDPAPPVEVVKCLKGEPINLASGRVNVVEFWATWCGPCKASMPHLSALAEKYKGRVDFAGIAVWEHGADPLPNVERFVAHAGNSMAYNVGYGGAGECAMAKTWLQAAKLEGIPQAFIVDKRGNIAWFGGPMEGLEDALELAVQDKLDPAAAAKVDQDFKAKLNNAKSLTQQINREARAGNLEKFLQLVHEKTRLEGFNADEIVSSAYTALAVSHPKLAAQYSEQILKDFGNAPDVLTAVAQAICDEKGKIKKERDVPFALNLLKKAEACQEADMEFNALYARALFLGKDYENAVKRQEEAIHGEQVLVAFMEEKAASSDPKEREKVPFLRKINAMHHARQQKLLKEYKAAAASRK